MEKNYRQLCRNGLHCCHYPWFEMHDVITVVRTEVSRRWKCWIRCSTKITKSKQRLSFSLLFLLALAWRLFTSCVLRKSLYGEFLMIGWWLITQHFSWRTSSSLTCDGSWCNKWSVIRKGGPVINPQRVVSLLKCLNYKSYLETLRNNDFMKSVFPLMLMCHKVQLIFKGAGFIRNISILCCCFKFKKTFIYLFAE